MLEKEGSLNKHNPPPPHPPPPSPLPSSVCPVYTTVLCRLQYVWQVRRLCAEKQTGSLANNTVGYIQCKNDESD